MAAVVRPRRRRSGGGLPALPQLLERKLYKTGQTRGADDDVIFQNRVSRSSTVLIPYRLWAEASLPPRGEAGFENGFIALISPIDYFGRDNIEMELAGRGLALGVNALVFYETRAEWLAHSPDALGWRPARARRDPLGGQYVARVPGTTAVENGEKIVRGFDNSGNKGAGIRVYEYASPQSVTACKLQLEALFWLCRDAHRTVQAYGMVAGAALTRSEGIKRLCAEKGLLDMDRLLQARLVNRERRTSCPLCREELSAEGFFNRMEQAVGREVPDLTVTQLNLFHIDELRTGTYGHRPYNLGWGHHHCNVVVKDSGIAQTLTWMEAVLRRNAESG